MKMFFFNCPCFAIGILQSTSPSTAFQLKNPVYYKHCGSFFWHWTANRPKLPKMHCITFFRYSNSFIYWITRCSYPIKAFFYSSPVAGYSIFDKNTFQFFRWIAKIKGQKDQIVRGIIDFLVKKSVSYLKITGCIPSVNALIGNITSGMFINNKLLSFVLWIRKVIRWNCHKVNTVMISLVV